jgi:hypothetical protein
VFAPSPHLVDCAVDWAMEGATSVLAWDKAKDPTELGIMCDNKSR